MSEEEEDGRRIEAMTVGETGDHMQSTSELEGPLVGLLGGIEVE